MKAGRARGEIAIVIWNAQSLANLNNDFGASCFVFNVVRPFRFRRNTLAEIMH